MPGDMEIPEFLHAIPEDADEATKLFMRAQAVINAVFHSFGDPDLKPGTYTLPTADLEEVISAALAMLISTDANLKTKRDVRLAVEDHCKFIRSFVDAMRERGDDTPSRLLDALNMQHTRPS
jgi:hypothetical protein